jgi:hypothetical protein
VSAEVLSRGAILLTRVGSREVAARAIGVSPRVIGHWCTGRVPSPDSRAKIEIAFPSVPAGSWSEASRTPPDGPAVTPPDGPAEHLARVQVWRRAAEARGAPAEIGKALEAERKALALTKFMAPAEIDLISSPKFTAALAAICGALKPWPEALIAVRAALSELE